MIGIFDSGAGGLTVLRAIRNRLPSADIVYFGDVKHAPYGSRSRAELSALTVQSLKLLHERGATSIVSACNSVSASLALAIFDTLEVTPDRLIEMVGPTVAQFRDSKARVLLCATPATIQSEIYQNAFIMVGKEITAVPVPDLAGAIDHGAAPETIEEYIRTAFSGVNIADFDVLVLACTHYPLVAESFTKVLGDIPLFDPAEAVAARVEKEWWPREVRTGEMHFVLSQESAQFRVFLTQLFPNDAYSVEVVE